MQRRQPSLGNEKQAKKRGGSYLGGQEEEIKDGEGVKKNPQ